MGGMGKFFANKVVAALVRSAAVLAVAAVLDVMMSGSLLWNLATGSYALQQSILQGDLGIDEPLPVVILDLSKVAPFRRNAVYSPSPSHADEMIEPWLALSNALPAIAAAKPSAILIDWELGLNGQFAKRHVSDFELTPAVKDSDQVSYVYARLMSSLKSADDALTPPGSPHRSVFFAAESVKDNNFG